MSAALQAALEVALSAAQAAGQAIRTRWETSVTVRHKGEIDLVTEADLEAEAAVVSRLRAAFPGDRIVAEEGGESGADAESGDRCWYVDPLDGTTNFAHGFPQFCVSITLADAAGLAVGVVHAPIYGFTFSAVRGGGAFFSDGRGGPPARMSVSACPDLDHALLATGFPYDARTHPDNNVDRFGALLRQCQGIRRAGSAALDLAFVARGWLDGYWESRLKPWDIGAGCLLVAEAGGQVTTFAGGPADFRDGAVVVSNARFHVELCRALAAARPLEK